VHREGSVGHQARDAMLLCMALSKKHEGLGTYIADSSNVCPVSYVRFCGIYPIFNLKVMQENSNMNKDLKVNSNLKLEIFRC
jgi:Retinoic acid induced 16-like protein